MFLKLYSFSTKFLVDTAGLIRLFYVLKVGDFYFLFKSILTKYSQNILLIMTDEKLFYNPVLLIHSLIAGKIFFLCEFKWSNNLLRWPLRF